MTPENIQIVQLKLQMQLDVDYFQKLLKHNQVYILWERYKPPTPYLPAMGGIVLVFFCEGEFRYKTRRLEYN